MLNVDHMIVLHQFSKHNTRVHCNIVGVTYKAYSVTVDCKVADV